MDHKGRSCSNSITFNFDITAHFLDEMLADTQPESCSLLIEPLIICKLTEVHEKFINIFFADASAAVFDPDLEGDKVGLFRRMLISLLVCPLNELHVWHRLNFN